MRALALIALLLATPLAAQEHRPPMASAETWSLGNLPLPAGVTGGPANLSAADPAFAGAPLPLGDFSLETTLAYRDVADGDVAGIALRGANGGWISLQLEQITPALLVAVRRHVAHGIDAHGELLATTAVPGWHGGRIRLKIERRGGMLHFAHARVDGEWQVLGPAFHDPTGGAGQAGVFAIDGAER